MPVYILLFWPHGRGLIMQPLTGILLSSILCFRPKLSFFFCDLGVLDDQPFTLFSAPLSVSMGYLEGSRVSLWKGCPRWVL